MSRSTKDATVVDEDTKTGVSDGKHTEKNSQEIPDEILNEPKELRVIRKAKRISKDAETTETVQVKIPYPSRQRRLRHRHRNRKLGEPKKGGIQNS